MRVRKGAQTPAFCCVKEGCEDGQEANSVFKGCSGLNGPPFSPLSFIQQFAYDSAAKPLNKSSFRGRQEIRQKLS